MSTPVDIFLADPMVTSMELSPFDSGSVAYAYRLWLDSTKSDEQLLEEVFRMLNIDHPADYRQRSLSVGDVVTIDRCRSYRCAALGWQQLSEPLLPRRGKRELIHWLRLRKHQLRPKFARLLCRLRGCTLAEYHACVRCGAFVYDPNFIPSPRWLSRAFDCWCSLQHTCVHRCEACRRLIWFSQERCCSDACFEDWFPF